VNWTTIVPGQSPFVAALTQVGIPGAALGMNIIVLTAVLSCLNSGLYVTSRALFALAAQGDAPEALIALNKRNVPARAILAGTVFAYGAMLTSIFLSATGVFTWLVNASGTAMLFLYLMIGAAEVRYRSTLAPEAQAGMLLKMWLFPGLSYLTMFGFVAVLVAMGFIADLKWQLFTTVILIAALFGIYLVFRHGRYVAVEASQA
jgi:GABA permease